MARITPAPTGSKSLEHLDPLLVQRLAQRLHCRKPEHIMKELGISLNTWNKLQEGSPIRASVAARLVDRFGELINDYQ
jgi:hypothetical protein